MFSTPDGKRVLSDLARFCGVYDTAFHEDARLHAVAEGRREVYYRIIKHLELKEEDFWNLYVDPFLHSLALKKGDTPNV